MTPHPGGGGGRPLASGRQLTPRLAGGQSPLGGGWHGRGGQGGSNGGGLGGAWGGGSPGGEVRGEGLGGASWAGGGGIQVGRFGGDGARAPLTSPCPPSNHTITINLTLTLAAS